MVQNHEKEGGRGRRITRALGASQPMPVKGKEARVEQFCSTGSDLQAAGSVDPRGKEEGLKCASTLLLLLINPL